MTHNPIIVALDTPDISHAKQLAGQLKGQVGVIKLGLEFFTANGAAGVRIMAEAGLPIFLDLKFHDIPNTVAKALGQATALQIAMTTIHTMGGADMMRSAKEAADEQADQLGIDAPLILGVTVLTSMDASDLQGIGVNGHVADQVKRLAELAVQSGLKGLVCSPQEIPLLRLVVGEDVTLVTPGIRPQSASLGDQKRVMTPVEAMQAGANYLVIGRPITQATDPEVAARTIYDSLS